MTRKAVCLILLVGAVVLSACTVRTTGSGGSGGEGGGGGLPPSTIAQVKDRGTLIVGTAPGYLPFDMKDVEGNFIGYDIDVGRAIAEALGVEVTFKQYDFAALISALKTGKIDIILAGMTITGERALEISFSDPYYSTGQALMVPDSDRSTNSWQDLDKPGNRIAVSRGTTGALLAKDLFTEAEVASYENLPNAALAVSQGKAAGVVYDAPGLRIYALQHPDQVRFIDETITKENLGIAVRKNDVATVMWLNSFLASYVGSLDEIQSREKWFESVKWFDHVQEGS